VFTEVMRQTRNEKMAKTAAFTALGWCNEQSDQTKGFAILHSFVMSDGSVRSTLSESRLDYFKFVRSLMENGPKDKNTVRFEIDLAHILNSVFRRIGQAMSENSEENE
ncbi:hypothetical protein LCGC14_2935850, partial [marine sediment metagenome]